MQENLEAMTAALRVLTAVTGKQQPDPEDIKALRAFDQTTNGRDIDELACDVIQKALMRRAKLRAASGD